MKMNALVKACIEKDEPLSLGTFEVTSGRLMVSDPCYKRGTWCQGILQNVRKGRWTAEVLYSNEGQWGSRVAVLEARAVMMHSSPHAWEEAQFEVGVDSGQVGIFDDSLYPDDPHTDDSFEGASGYNLKDFYGECCYLTCEDGRSAGLVRATQDHFLGVVSSSGYGDGSYVCDYQKAEDGTIVAVRIIFIEDGPEGE